MDISERIAHSKYLKWGDVAKLSALTGVDRKTIERYIQGKTNKCSKEGTVIDLLRLRKKESDDLINEMKLGA